MAPGSGQLDPLLIWNLYPMGRPPRTTILVGGIPVVSGSKFDLRPGKYQHGTRSAYVAGCCCLDCTRAQTDYTRQARQAKLGRPARRYTKKET